MTEFALRQAAFLPYIEQMALQPISIPSDAVDRSSEERGASLRSWAWSSSLLGWCRLTEIQTGAGFRVANWAAFPRFDVDVPTCQAELIEVKGRLFLLVLDALYASPDGTGPATQELRSASRELESVLPVQTRPEWSEGFITDAAIWSRTATADALDEGVKIFHWFMGASVRWMRGSLDGRADARAAQYRRMRRRFLDNEPSRPFMTKTFGADWSEAYMEDFLFPAREREHLAQAALTRACGP